MRTQKHTSYHLEESTAKPKHHPITSAGRNTLAGNRMRQVRAPGPPMYTRSTIHTHTHQHKRIFCKLYTPVILTIFEPRCGFLCLHTHITMDNVRLG